MFIYDNGENLYLGLYVEINAMFLFFLDSLNILSFCSCKILLNEKRKMFLNQGNYKVYKRLYKYGELG